MRRMEVERRTGLLTIENAGPQGHYLGVYALGVSSMQLHTVMLGFDVARCALVRISTPPFPTGGMAKHALRQHRDNTAYGVMLPGRNLRRFGADNRHCAS